MDNTKAVDDHISTEIRRLEQAVAKTKSPYLKRDYEKAISRLKRKIHSKLKGDANVRKIGT